MIFLFASLRKTRILNHWFVWFCFWFLWVFPSHSRMFHSYGDVTITGKGLQILTFARHSWPLILEGTLACHTDYDTGHLWGPVTLKPIVECWQWSCHYLFLRLRYVAAGIRTPNLPLAGRTLLATVPLLACEDNQKYNRLETVKRNLAKSIGYILIVSLSSAVLTANRINLPSVWIYDPN